MHADINMYVRYVHAVYCIIGEEIWAFFSEYALHLKKQLMPPPTTMTTDPHHHLPAPTKKNDKKEANDALIRKLMPSTPQMPIKNNQEAKETMNDAVIRKLNDLATVAIVISIWH